MAYGTGNVLSTAQVFVGSMAFGTLIPERAAFRLLDCAAQQGIRALDTAGVYGRAAGPGVAEKIIGRWLAVSATRDDWMVATKVGVSDSSGKIDVSVCGVRQSLERSLDRMRIQHVDLLQLHFPGDPNDDERICEAVVELYGEGLFSSFGTCNFPPWRIARLHSWLTEAGVAYVSEQSLLNLIDHRARDDVMPRIQALGMGLLAYSPLAGGVLSPPDDDAGARRRVGSAHRRRQQLRSELAQLAEICAGFSLDTPSAAIAWLRQVGVNGIVSGARTPRQLRQVVAAWRQAVLSQATIRAMTALFESSSAPVTDPA